MILFRKVRKKNVGKGLFRFAKTLSKIAESFHNDALENIEEGKIYKSKDS